MTVAEWALMLGFEALLLAFLPQVRRLWRDETHIFDGRLVRTVRAIPFLMSVGVVLIPLMLATYLTGDDERATVGAAVFGLAALAVLTGQIAVSVMLWRWGRPKALVPPHLREVGGDKTYRGSSSGIRRARRAARE